MAYGVLIGILLALSLSGSGFAAEKKSTAELAALIDRLKDVDTEGIGFSPSMSGEEFLPYPETAHQSMVLLGQHEPQNAAEINKILSSLKKE
jgi:hypothetical protein